MFRGSMVAIAPMRADGGARFRGVGAAGGVSYRQRHGDAIVAVGTTGESATLDYEDTSR